MANLNYSQSSKYSQSRCFKKNVFLGLILSRIFDVTKTKLKNNVENNNYII